MAGHKKAYGTYIPAPPEMDVEAVNHARRVVDSFVEDAEEVRLVLDMLGLLPDPVAIS